MVKEEAQSLTIIFTYVLRSCYIRYFKTLKSQVSIKSFVICYFLTNAAVLLVMNIRGRKQMFSTLAATTM